jgi:Ca-activated chloride channel homolog
MRLASPEYLYLLLLFPLFYGIFRFIGKRTKRGHRPTFDFANAPALTATDPGFRTRLAWLPAALRILGLVALVVALARPQAEDWETITGEGLDIMFCLDMSGSMNAVDKSSSEVGDYQSRGKEPPNRFEVARDTLKQFVANRKGDRIGLVVFSSDAYLKFPLTLDYETVLAQLDSLTLDSRERKRPRDACTNGCTINGSKTAIGDALSKAYKRLEKSDGAGKIIVLVTDGNNNSGKLEPMDVARYIGDQPDSSRPRVYTFLVGSSEKTRTPAMMQTFGGDIVLAKNNGFLEYAPVEDTVDADRLREIAEAARGVFHATYDDHQFRASFETLEKSKHLEQKVARHTEKFLPFLLAALALLLTEFLLRVTFLRRFP